MHSDLPGAASHTERDWMMQICASPYKSSQTLPQRTTIYGNGESLRSTPVVTLWEAVYAASCYACSVALFQERYPWRHNSVLSVLQRHLLKFWDYARQQPEHQQAPVICFVPERARAPRLPVIRRSRRPLPYLRRPSLCSRLRILV